MSVNNQKKSVDLAGLFEFPDEKSSEIGVGLTEWIMWKNRRPEDKATEADYRALIDNKIILKVRWPSIDDRQKKKINPDSPIVSAILQATGQWDEMADMRDNIVKYGIPHPSKKDRSKIMHGSVTDGNKKPHGNSKAAKAAKAQQTMSIADEEVPNDSLPVTNHSNSRKSISHPAFIKKKLHGNSKEAKAAKARLMVSTINEKGMSREFVHRQSNTSEKSSNLKEINSQTKAEKQLAAHMKKISIANSQQQIRAEVEKNKKTHYEDLLSSDEEEYSMFSLRQQVKSLRAENQRLREYISGMEAYERVYCKVEQLQTALCDALQYVADSQAQLRALALENVKNQQLVFDDMVPCVSSDDFPKVHRSTKGKHVESYHECPSMSHSEPEDKIESKKACDITQFEKYEAQCGDTLDKQSSQGTLRSDSFSKDNNQRTMPDETVSPGSKHFLVDEMERKRRVRRKLSSEDEEDFDISHHPEDMESEYEQNIENVIEPEPFTSVAAVESNNVTAEDDCTIDLKTLEKCNLATVTLYVGDLVSALFTDDELATSSITGKISNIHRNQAEGVRHKNRLSQKKLKLLYEYVEKEFPGYDKKKVNTKIKEKLKYAARKKFGVGFKKPCKKEPSNLTSPQCAK